MNTEKDRIILAIAFIKTYPKLEDYLKSQRNFNELCVKHGDFKLLSDAEIADIDFYNKQSNISTVALINGYNR